MRKKKKKALRSSLTSSSSLSSIWAFSSLEFHINHPQPDHDACGAYSQAQGSHYINDNNKAHKKKKKGRAHTQRIMCISYVNAWQHDTHTHTHTHTHQGCTHVPEGRATEADDARSEVWGHDLMERQLCLKEKSSALIRWNKSSSPLMDLTKQLQWFFRNRVEVISDCGCVADFRFWKRFSLAKAHRWKASLLYCLCHPQISNEFLWSQLS